MKKIKRAIAILLVMIVSFSVISVGAEAVSVSTTDSDYGYMIPTNYNFTKSLSTVYLYGNYDYMNFYINSKMYDNYFIYEIYSDAAYTKPVYSGYTFCEHGTFTYSAYIKLLGTFSSGTYYCITYAADIDDYDNVTVSTPSISSFKIVVNRNPSYSQNIVGLKSTTNTVDGPKVSWYKLNNSTVKYNIYRRYLTGDKWVKVGTVGGSTYTFTDKTVKNIGGRYVYTVRGEDKNGNLTRYHYSGVNAAYTPAPEITSVQVYPENKIRISWTHKNTSGISPEKFIYRKENGGSWQKIAYMPSGSSDFYYDTKVKSGNNYQYTVRVRIPFKTGDAFSAYYDGKAVDYIEAPKLNPLHFTDEGMTVSWNAIEDAKKYAIYRKSLEDNSTWKILGRVDGNETSYIDKTAVENGAYRYTVRSESETNQGSYYSKGVCYVKFDQPTITTVTPNQYSTYRYFTITWNKVAYAKSYYLMYDDGSGWQKYGGPTESGAINFYFDPNEYKEYKFSVMPFIGDVYGTYKTDVPAYGVFPKFGVSSVVYENYIRLTWGNAKADSYNVYRKPKGAPDSEYELLKNTTYTAYNDYSAQTDVPYTYSVRAVHGSVEQKFYIPSVSVTKYPSDKYIKSFKVNKIVSYDNKTNKTSYAYKFEVDKTPEGQNLKTVVYALSVKGWVNVTTSYFNFETLEFATAEPVFYAVVYDSNGRTPIDGCTGVPADEMCAAPKIKLNVVKGGMTVSWDAVDGAVAYRVVETNNRIERVVDGSTLSIKINSSDLSDNLRLRVSAVHSNGNVAESRLDNISCTWSIPAVLKVTSGENGNTVYLTGPMHYENSVYHIFRKAPGQKNWTRIGYYQGKPYVDSTAQAGVKYTYTVRLYDYVNKFYMSYYDTVGVQVGQIQTPRLNEAKDYGNYILVSWNYQYNEKCFYVYRRTANSGWIKIATVNSYEANWFLDTTAQSGETYYYTVRAYDGTILSGYDPVGVKCTKS